MYWPEIFICPSLYKVRLNLLVPLPLLLEVCHYSGNMFINSQDRMPDTNLLMHVFLLPLYEFLFFHPSQHHPQLSSHQSQLNQRRRA